MVKKTVIFMLGLMIILFMALPISAADPAFVDPVLEAMVKASASPEEKAAQIQAEAQIEVAQTQKEAAQTSAIAIMIGGAIIAVAIIAVNRNKRQYNSKPTDITMKVNCFVKVRQKLSVDDVFAAVAETKLKV